MNALLIALVALQDVQERLPPAWCALRYEEDWSSLRDPDARRDLFDPIKFIPLDGAGHAWLTLGANLREQFEFYREQDFGNGPARDGYLLHRFYPYADLHLGTPVRAFVMLKNALAFGTENDPFPSQQDTIDVHQAFVDLVWRPDPVAVTFRPGRQELLYGAGRILDDRSGPNAKFTYDCARALVEGPGARVDVLYAVPVRSELHGFDDGRAEGISLWGAYAQMPLGRALGLDAYVLGIDRRNWVFAEGTGDTLRHALGVRFFRPRAAGLDWDVEPILEAGSFAGGTLLAWGVYSDLGWTFDQLPWLPRIGCRSDAFSGDRDQGDGKLNTFDSFFPRGILQGEAGNFGPSNMLALTPELSLQPLPSIYLSARWSHYWRQSVEDAVYTLNLGVLIPAGASREPYLGNELSLTFEWYAQRHVILSSVYSFTTPGRFLTDNGFTEAQTFVSVTLTVKI